MFLHKIKGLGWFYCCFLLYTISFSQDYIDNWISTDDLYKIKINMTIEEVKSTLGDPMFIESINDDDVIIIKYIYSFRTKVYNREKLEESNISISELSSDWGKTTKIQFIFTDDKLTSWEEDKLTLSMSSELSSSGGATFATFNFLLNIIVITLNAAVLMSL